MNQEILIPAGGVTLPGDLDVPEGATAVVVFAHGSGSSRLSSRNRLVASVLRESGRFGTLLFDLLTPAEDETYANRFDVGLLADRLEAATSHVLESPHVRGLDVGLFGASTGAAAAVIVATRMSRSVSAVVSRGGRPDLAGEALRYLTAPTLFIVGGADLEVIGLNERALALVRAEAKALEIVPGATHLFEEPGTLDRAAGLARSWFERYLAG